MPIPKMMKAVVTLANGGMEQLVYKEVPLPIINKGEVLIKVLAAGINNTEINTRMGWYSSKVTQATDQLAEEKAQTASSNESTDGGWSAPTPFPLIQGTDCCGEIVEVAGDVSSDLLGKRVLIRSCIRTHNFESLDTVWMASDFDGAFAQYVKIWASEVFPVSSDWSDEELASIPCAYGTAENMLHRANVSRSDTVLITGASGGVGSAAVQLAKRRGAQVFAVASKDKHEQIKGLGADRIFDRHDDLIDILGESSVDVVVDNVAGEAFGNALFLLKRGGRLTSSGAIAGPMVTMDMRQFYLKDITLIGTTAWDEPVFPNLIQYIENNEIRPLVAKTFPLENIIEAQTEFLEKKHVGKFVLIPPNIRT